MVFSQTLLFSSTFPVHSRLRAHPFRIVSHAIPTVHVIPMLAAITFPAFTESGSSHQYPKVSRSRNSTGHESRCSSASALHASSFEQFIRGISDVGCGMFQMSSCIGSSGMRDDLPTRRAVVDPLAWVAGR